MSYLGTLRLQFSGKFQADPSTVNNDVRHFDNETFIPSFQQPQTEEAMNGWWEPRGTGAFRLVGCRVTMVSHGDGSTSTTDPVVGMSIADANARVAGKLVDLDPQQQLASEIWGLIVRLADGRNDLFSGTFTVSPFTDVWWARAQGQGAGGDMGAGSMFQSVITPVTWGDTSGSRFLQELRAACSDGVLSIKFNLDGYNTNPESPSFTLGRIVGTIGPSSNDEPKRFVLGRQLLPQVAKSNPSGLMNFMPAVVDARTKRVYADFGNALPTSHPGGPLKDIGKLELGYLDAKDAFHSLGTVAYQEKDWYTLTGAVQAFPHDRTLTPSEEAALKTHRLAVTQDGTAILRENDGGVYARADQFTFRLEPGETADVELWATQYGKPLANAKMIAFRDKSGLQSAGNPSDGLGTPPEYAVPETAISFPATLQTDAQGRATLSIAAFDPNNPRGYIDGQVYGVRYLLGEVAKNLKTDSSFGHNPADFVSLLVFNSYAVPDPVTWYDLQPLFEQYGNLYPIMDGIIDFRSYDSMAANAQLLAFAFGLPLSDPNHMPVTRDLSKGKREAILTWLTILGADGKPLRGERALAPPPQPKPVPSVASIAIAIARAAAAIAAGAHPKAGAKAYAANTRDTVQIPEETE